MQRNKQGDRGVSPVIGVVLMVAITVVLAAGIASIALNTGNDVTETGEAAYQYIPADGNNGELEINKLGDGSSVVIVDPSGTEAAFSSLGVKDLTSQSLDADATLELFIEKDGERTFVEELNN